MNDDSSELRIQTACLMVLATVAIGLTLYWLRPVLVPFVLALFFAAGLAPILDYIEDRLGAPRLIAVAIAFLVGLLILFVVWTFIWLSVQSLIQDSGEYVKRVHEMAKNVNELLEPTGIEIPLDEEHVLERTFAGEASSIGGYETPAIREGETHLPVEDNDLDSLEEERKKREKSMAEAKRLRNATIHSYASYAMQLISVTLLDLSSNAVMVLIFMFFMLLGGSTSVIPRGGVWREIEAKIRGYIVTKTIISFFTGVAFFLVLWIFGVPLALVFGLLAFLLNFIPNIGPVIASLLPLPLIVLHPDLSLWQMILAIVLSSGVQVISGNVIEPKVMGDSFELHPIAILLTLMFWGVIWGIVGMFLAVPMTAAVVILLARFEHTRPIADVLAGRFEALTAMLGGEVEAEPAAPA